MSRDVRLFLDDMITACEKIQRYVAGRPRETFERDEQAFDAVLKNLEIIGEASKRFPASFRDRHPEIQWREIAGLRDIVVHEYFGTRSRYRVGRGRESGPGPSRAAPNARRIFFVDSDCSLASPHEADRSRVRREPSGGSC